MAESALDNVRELRVRVRWNRALRRKRNEMHVGRADERDATVGGTAADGDDAGGGGDGLSGFGGRAVGFWGKDPAIRIAGCQSGGEDGRSAKVGSRSICSRAF